MMLIHFLPVMLTAYATALPSKTIKTRQDDVNASVNTQFVNWPLSYIALGDSYAAGIGAGHFFIPDDIENKRCKRFDQAYPVLAQSLPIMNPAWSDFTFLACTGAKLGDMQAQFDKLGDKRANVVSLSISGNNFNFANVVIHCVYSQYFWESSMEKACNEEIQKAQSLIRDDSIWKDYTDKARYIMDNHMTADGPDGKPTSVLMLTGYPRFWGTTFDGDPCSEIKFPMLGRAWAGNKMRKTVRDVMNKAVDDVNAKIRNRMQQDIDPSGRRWRLVDPNVPDLPTSLPEDTYTEKRFCEPGRKTADDAIGANSDSVNFISLETTINEDEWVADHSEFEQLWSQVDVTGDGNLGDPRNQLHKMSCFHPKRAGHLLTAREMAYELSKWGQEQSFSVQSSGGESPTPTPSPPKQCPAGHVPNTDCFYLDWSQIPEYINFMDRQPGWACYSDDTFNWCDLVTQGSCQATIGWDPRELPGGAPIIPRTRFMKWIGEHTDDWAGEGTCSGGIESFGPDCSLSPNCNPKVGATFCLKSVGVDCRPGSFQ